VITPCRIDVCDVERRAARRTRRKQGIVVHGSPSHCEGDIGRGALHEKDASLAVIVPLL